MNMPSSSFPHIPIIIHRSHHSRTSGTVGVRSVRTSIYSLKSSNTQQHSRTSRTTSMPRHESNLQKLLEGNSMSEEEIAAIETELSRMPKVQVSALHSFIIHHPITHTHAVLSIQHRLGPMVLIRPFTSFGKLCFVC